MKLTYWFAEHKDDHLCYALIAKTKKEAEAKRAAEGVERYYPAVKRTIEYADAFDLLDQLTGEGGGRGYGERDKGI